MEHANLQINDHAMVISKEIKVLIVDDHVGWRNSIKNLVSTAKDMVVVGMGGSGNEAIEQVVITNPDILLLDMELPDQRGDRVMQQLREMHAEVKVLTISSYLDRDYILGMMHSGAAGYITKDEAPSFLLEAIRTIVNEDKKWFSPQVIQNSIPTSLEQQALTQREMRILQLLAEDRSAEEIASALSISQSRVQKHLMLLMRKFETETPDSLKRVARHILAQRNIHKNDANQN